MLNNKFYSAVCLIAVVALSGCGQSNSSLEATQKNAAAVESDQKNASIEKDQPAIEDGEKDQEMVQESLYLDESEVKVEPFEEGVRIDFNKIIREVPDLKEVLQTLEHNLEALISRDQEEFAKDMIGGTVEGWNIDSVPFSFEKDKKYMFPQIANIERVTDSSMDFIRITVRVVEEPENTDDQYRAYVFTKNEEGKWLINNID